VKLRTYAVQLAQFWCSSSVK